MRTLPFAAAALLLAAGFAQAEGFRSPSGNVHCVPGDAPGAVECEIREPARPIRPELRDCEGDPIFNDEHRVLPYDQTLRGNGWQCTSKPSGMTCSNSRGHGFEISSRRQRLF